MKSLAPLTLLTVGILHGNNLRDIDTDRKAGVTTLATLMGRGASKAYYAALVVGCYLGLWMMAPGKGTGGGWGGMGEGGPVTPGRMAWVTAGVAKGVLGKCWKGEVEGLDEETAKLHMIVGTVVAAGIYWVGR